MALNILLKSQLQRLVDKLFAQIYSYGVSSTARNEVAKVVTYEGFVLKTGAHISVCFIDTTTSDPSSGAITMNVNSTGVKSVYLSNTNTACTYEMASLFCDSKVNSFVYDGSHWVLLSVDGMSVEDALITTEEFENFD